MAMTRWTQKALPLFVVCLAAVLSAFARPALAQTAPAPGLGGKPSNPVSTDTLDQTDTWIFSGVLPNTKESFSGTLVATKTDSQFELKLAGGATCDGGKLKGEVGFVRLPEITCTDDRTLRALFVPQAGNQLKVFGHVGDERFMASAHLLGTEAPPAPKQTAQPKGPLGLPPPGMGQPPPLAPK